MPQLNRPLTALEAKTILETKFTHPLTASLFIQLHMEPSYQAVRYRGAIDRVDYERPDTFYGVGPRSPSDCVWLVPCGFGALRND